MAKELNKSHKCKIYVISRTRGSGSLTVHSNLWFSAFPVLYRFLIAVKSALDH